MERFTGGEARPINPEIIIIAAGVVTKLRNKTRTTQVGTKKLSGFVCPNLSIRFQRKPAVSDEVRVSIPVAIPAKVIEPVTSCTKKKVANAIIA